MNKHVAVIGCLFILSFYGFVGAENSSSNADEEVSGVKIKSIEQDMSNDQDVMNMILSLQNNPDFAEALNDPELMRQVKENDIEALKNNPAFLKLMDDQTVKEIENKVNQQK